MKYRVWWDHKRLSRRDGQDIEADSAAEAAKTFGLETYCALQHVDPGSVFVRSADGEVSRYRIWVHVEIRSEEDPIITGET